MIFENSVLEYLHDADLHRVSIDFVLNERRLTFTATFHPDCGLSSINGKTIEVVASDILVITCCFLGYSMGQESIDSCIIEVPEKAREILLPAIQAGIRESKTGLSLLTHTGSRLEVLYETLTIKEVTAQEAGPHGSPAAGSPSGQP